MTDSLNIGKTWTVTVPAGNGRTIGQNMWQYSVFPMSTAPSIMYPCDKLSSMNDAQLMNFDFGTTQFLDSSTNIMYQVMPMMKQWMAQQAELYQKIMENLHSSSKVTVENPDKKDNIDGTKVIKESEINSVLNRIAADPVNKDRFTKNIEYTDSNGNKVTDKNLLQRLIQLSIEYYETPDTAEISEENYKLLWDIAGKYDKTGELSTSDYKILLEIAKNPGGPGAYQKPADEGDDDSKEATRPEKYQAAIDNTEDYKHYKKLSQSFKDTLYDSDATEDSLALITKDVNKYNVLYIAKDFEKYHGNLNEENLIDAIFDDTSRWGKTRWSDELLSDDAKPSVTSLSNALIERANDLIKNNSKLEKSKVEALSSQVKSLQNAIQNVKFQTLGWSVQSLTSESKENISQNFQGLVDKLMELETEIYGEVEI